MNTLEKIGAAVIIGPIAILVISLLVAIFGVLPVWWAWNTVIPHVFGLPTINGWQALAITWLAGMFRSINYSKK